MSFFTVAQLIEKLQQAPQNMIVVDECRDPIMRIEVIDADILMEGPFVRLSTTMAYPAKSKVVETWEA